MQIVDSSSSSYSVVEGHRDCYELMHWLARGEKNPLRDRLIPRLREGRVSMVVYAIGGDSIAHSRAREQRLLATLENLRLFKKCIADTGSSVVLTSRDVPTEHEVTDPKFVLHLEGGLPLTGSLEALETFHELGVRSLQPTWNLRNELGDGVHESESGGGLSRFGRDAVRLAQELAMIVDLAHASESTFWDIMRVTTGPVIVSHANARAVHDHRTSGDPHDVPER